MKMNEIYLESDLESVNLFHRKIMFASERKFFINPSVIHRWMSQICRIVRGSVPAVLQGDVIIIVRTWTMSNSTKSHFAHSSTRISAVHYSEHFSSWERNSSLNCLACEHWSTPTQSMWNHRKWNVSLVQSISMYSFRCHGFRGKLTLWIHLANQIQQFPRLLPKFSQNHRTIFENHWVNFNVTPRNKCWFESRVNNLINFHQYLNCLTEREIPSEVSTFTSI
jgi:hypothetical protein